MTNPHASQTCLVLLGSSEYPSSPGLSNPQFKRSAEAVRGYFAAEHGFGLAPQNVLDLFDSHKDWLAQINQVAQFVKDFSARLASESSTLNVLIYCIGHGYNPNRQAFYLCLRDYIDRDQVNGLMDVANLNSAINIGLPRNRICRFIYIIDACFSGQAANGFCDAPSSRGIALLCAADRESAALAPEEQDLTLFTGLLLDVLKRPHSSEAFWSQCFQGDPDRLKAECSTDPKALSR